MYRHSQILEVVEKILGWADLSFEHPTYHEGRALVKVHFSLEALILTTAEKQPKQGSKQMNYQEKNAQKDELKRTSTRGQNERHCKAERKEEMRGGEGCEEEETER